MIRFGLSYEEERVRLGTLVGCFLVDFLEFFYFGRFVWFRVGFLVFLDFEISLFIFKGFSDIK